MEQRRTDLEQVAYAKQVSLGRLTSAAKLDSDAEAVLCCIKEPSGASRSQVRFVEYLAYRDLEICRGIDV